MAAPAEATHTMRCLEVWGGNDAVDHGVVMPGLDAWLYSRPVADEPLGGDIHYVSSCAAGLVTRVLIADVSGHGSTVASVADHLRVLMRRYINYVDQTQFFEGVNVEFGQLSAMGAFATAVIATYFAPEDRLTVSNAGHPCPLLYSARSRQWSLLTGPDRARVEAPANVPLGVAGPARYDQFQIPFSVGDMLVLYTDSLIEARGADGQPVGQQGLLRLAQSLDASEPEEFLRALLRSIGLGGPERGDDVTVLILRGNAFKPRPGLALQLRVHGRMLRELGASLLPGGREFPWCDTGPYAHLRNMLKRIHPRWAGDSGRGAHSRA